MSAESNKERMRSMVDELFNKGNTDAVDEYVAPGFIEHEELPPGTPEGREGLKYIISMMRTAFPDFKATVDQMIAEDDKVVIIMTWSGTQKGEFMGVPASGNTVSFGVFDVIRMKDGKAVEHWGQMDTMGLMHQIGAIPAPGEGQ